MEVVPHLMLGGKLAVQGFMASYTDSDVKSARSTHLKHLFWWIVAVVTTTAVILVPIRLVAWLLLFFMADSPLLVGFEESTQLSSVLFRLASLASVLGLLVIRTLMGTGELYFVVLSKHDESCASYLLSKPVLATSVKLWLAFKRLLTTLAWLLLLQILTFLPVIGPSVFAIVAFFRMAKKLGYPVVLALSVLTIVPLSYFPSTGKFCFEVTLAAHAVGRELFNPYFQRLMTNKEDRAEGDAVLSSWILIGFGLPFLVVFSIPAVGLWAFSGAEAAAALATAALSKRHRE